MKIWQFFVFPHFMPQKRVRSRTSRGVLSARSYASPGKIKESHRMLLVADFEKTESYSRTAQNFGVHEGTVKLWVERFNCTGDVASPSPTRQPRVTTSDLMKVSLKLIDDAYRDLPYGISTWSELWREVKRRGFTCSITSLRNMLKNSKEKIVLRTALKTLFLSNNHKERRVQFATEVLQWSDAALENIIFCDEKKFTCKRSTRPTYLCRKSDPPKEQTGELEP